MYRVTERHFTVLRWSIHRFCSSKFQLFTIYVDQWEENERIGEWANEKKQNCPFLCLSSSSHSHSHRHQRQCQRWRHHHIYIFIWGLAFPKLLFVSPFSYFPFPCQPQDSRPKTQDSRLESKIKNQKENQNHNENQNQNQNQKWGQDSRFKPDKIHIFHMKVKNESKRTKRKEKRKCWYSETHST